MKKLILCIFVLVLAQGCFAQVAVNASASATIVNVDTVLKEAKVGPLPTKADSMRVFNNIMLERAKEIKIKPFQPKEGMTMEEVEKGMGKPLQDPIPFECCPDKWKLIYRDKIIYIKNWKVDIIFPKRN